MRADKLPPLRAALRPCGRCAAEMGASATELAFRRGYRAALARIDVNLLSRNLIHARKNPADITIAEGDVPRAQI